MYLAGVGRCWEVARPPLHIDLRAHTFKVYGQPWSLLQPLVETSASCPCPVRSSVPPQVPRNRSERCRRQVQEEVLPQAIKEVAPLPSCQVVSEAQRGLGPGTANFGLPRLSQTPPVTHHLLPFLVRLLAPLPQKHAPPSAAKPAPSAPMLLVPSTCGEALYYCLVVWLPSILLSH